MERVLSDNGSCYRATRRLRLSVDAFLTYPFGRPGYRFDDVPENEGRSLNMLRCPVADYLGQQGASDLCAGSWCNLDYALAEMWGGTLQRSSTLVLGADCCDFRFHALPVGEQVPVHVDKSGESAKPHGGCPVTRMPISVLQTSPNAGSGTSRTWAVAR